MPQRRGVWVTAAGPCGSCWLVLHEASSPNPILAPPLPTHTRHHTDSGVTSFDKVLPALRAMAELGLPLLVHGEVTEDHVDMFDREAVFIKTKLVRQLLSACLKEAVCMPQRPACAGGRAH